MKLYIYYSIHLFSGVLGIYGTMDQTARKIAVAKFRKGDCRVLVVTDVAARGIGIIFSTFRFFSSCFFKIDCCRFASSRQRHQLSFRWQCESVCASLRKNSTCRTQRLCVFSHHTRWCMPSWAFCKDESSLIWIDSIYSCLICLRCICSSEQRRRIKSHPRRHIVSTWTVFSRLKNLFLNIKHWILCFIINK